MSTLSREGSLRKISEKLEMDLPEDDGVLTSISITPAASIITERSVTADSAQNSPSSRRSSTTRAYMVNEVNTYLSLTPKQQAALPDLLITETHSGDGSTKTDMTTETVTDDTEEKQMPTDKTSEMSFDVSTINGTPTTDVCEFWENRSIWIFEIFVQLPGETISVCDSNSATLTDSSPTPTLDTNQQFCTTAIECPTAVECLLQGVCLPNWVNGRLIMSSPALYQFSANHALLTHVEDAMSMVHSIHMVDGRATYQSRFVESKAYVANVTAGRLVSNEFGTVKQVDTSLNLVQREWQRMRLVHMPSDNCHRIAVIGSQLHVVNSVNRACRLDPVTLDTLEADINTAVTCPNVIMTASAPKHEVSTGELLNIGMDKKRNYVFLKTKETTDDEMSALYQQEIVSSYVPPTKLKPSPWLTSFALTDRLIIITETPSSVNLAAIAKHATPLTQNISWRLKTSCNLHALRRHNPRATYNTIKYTFDECAQLTHVNAYEQDGCVILDGIFKLKKNQKLMTFSAIRSESSKTVRALKVGKLREWDTPKCLQQVRFVRYVLPLQVPVVSLWIAEWINEISQKS